MAAARSALRRLRIDLGPGGAVEVYDSDGREGTGTFVARRGGVNSTRTRLARRRRAALRVRVRVLVAVAVAVAVAAAPGRAAARRGLTRRWRSGSQRRRRRRQRGRDRGPGPVRRCRRWLPGAARLAICPRVTRADGGARFDGTEGGEALDREEAPAGETTSGARGSGAKSLERERRRAGLAVLRGVRFS